MEVTKMESGKMSWIEYRNYLRAIACTMDINTIEYRNIVKRIKYAHERAYTNPKYKR